MRLIPPTFTGSKVKEDPQNFIDEMEKIFHVMHSTDIEGIEFATYQLKDMAYQWYEEWDQPRGNDTKSTLWDDFSSAFLDRFFP